MKSGLLLIFAGLLVIGTVVYHHLPSKKEKFARKCKATVAWILPLSGGNTKYYLNIHIDGETRLVKTLPYIRSGRILRLGEEVQAECYHIWRQEYRAKIVEKGFVDIHAGGIVDDVFLISFGLSAIAAGVFIMIP